MYVTGRQADPDYYVARWYLSDAAKAETAHLVSGFEQVGHVHLLLSEFPIVAYMGHKPKWYPDRSNSWTMLENATSGEDAIVYWRDACVAACFRAHDDDVEFVQVDLRYGVVYGGNVSEAETDLASKCRCYTDGIISNSSSETHSPSHAAPNDIRALQFLSSARLVPDSTFNGHSLRKYLNIYAVHRSQYASTFFTTLQSSMYHGRVLNHNNLADVDQTFVAEHLLSDTMGVANERDCFFECASKHGTDVKTVGYGLFMRVDFEGLTFGGAVGQRYFDDEPRCRCMSVDLLDFEHDTRWIYPHGRITPTSDEATVTSVYYKVQFCPNVVAASDRSLVYTKEDNAVCAGVPVGSGYVLSSQSILSSVDPGDVDLATDVKCKELCDENDQCAVAHSHVSTMGYHDLVHRLIPPPPSPPRPPSAPPPGTPPLPPFPPTIPPLESSGYRLWSPGYNLPPLYDSVRQRYTLTCGFKGHTNGFSAPVYARPSQLAVLDQARTMQNEGTYEKSLCPYECTRIVIEHGFDDDDTSNLKTGVGLTAARLSYAGREDASNGFSAYATASAPSGTTLMMPIFATDGVTMATCRSDFGKHKLVATHGLWIFTSENAGARIGECRFFLATRDETDRDMWEAFYQYAKEILRLGHYDQHIEGTIASAFSHPSSAVECVDATSETCAWWSEFELDADYDMSCRPRSDASNVVTPAMLLAELASGNVLYPPPAPPPPDPPSVPPSPGSPPDTFRCIESALPSARYHKKVQRAPDPDNPVEEWKVRSYRDLGLPQTDIVQQQCWRWDSANDWPPFVAHRDIYSDVQRCNNGDRSRDIQWGASIRQPHLPEDSYDVLRQNNNECPILDAFSSVDWYNPEVPGTSGVYSQIPLGVDGGGMLGQNMISQTEGNSPGFDEVRKDGQYCSDGSKVGGGWQAKYDDVVGCDLGTQLDACGIVEDLVVFGHSDFSWGYSANPQSGGYELPILSIRNNQYNGETEAQIEEKVKGRYRFCLGWDGFWHDAHGVDTLKIEETYDEVLAGTKSAIPIIETLGTAQAAPGAMSDGSFEGGDPPPSTFRHPQSAMCLDGGPGSVNNSCPYGSHSYACGHRRFAFRMSEAGPDVPDDSCYEELTDQSTGASYVSAKANNGFCEDQLMWSRMVPGQPGACKPNTDRCVLNPFLSLFPNT